MKRVIVTGATSMLGIATIKECVNNGVEVLAISRARSRRKAALPNSELITFVECDLSDLKEIDFSIGIGKANAEEKYDVLYHFGWGYTDKVTRDNPCLQMKNIEYTLEAVKLSHRAGCRVFVGAGSQAEYGRIDGVITENVSCNPEVAYGICKLAAGRLAATLCKEYGITCIWTRTFSVYGMHDSPNVMTSYAVSQFIKGEEAKFSSGMQLWDYLFEDDAGVYFYLLGNKSLQITYGKDTGLGNCVINIASGDCRRLREYIIEMANLFGENFVYSFAEEPPKIEMSIQPDVSLLRKITGYIPQVKFSEGIRRILQFNTSGYSI